MSYYNNLKNTQINGPLNIQDDPTIGGPVAAFNCSRGGTFGGLLTASTGVNTPYINPQGITSLAESTTLPNTISNGSVILICNALTVTLPSPTAGYCLYFVYDQSLGTGGVATISYPGALNYENPIGVFNNNATNFSMNPNTSFVALASGSEWYIIANSGLLDGIAGLGLLAKLNSTISTTGTGPYTFTVASGNSWVFNGLLTAAGGLTVSGTVTLPAGSIALAALNGMFSTAHTWTALNTFSAGVSISGGFAVTAGTVTFPVGSISSGAFANGSLQYVDITSSLNGLLNTKANLSGGNTWTGNQTFTGTSGVTFSGTSGINVTTGATISGGGLSVTGSTILNNAADFWGVSSFHADLSIDANCTWWGTTSLADFKCPVSCENGFTSTGGFTVASGAVSFPAGSIALAALNGLFSATHTWTGINTFSGPFTSSGGFSATAPGSSLTVNSMGTTITGDTEFSTASAAANFDCTVTMTNGLTVSAGGATVGGGLTVNTGGLTVSAGAVSLPASSVAGAAINTNTATQSAITNGYLDATSSVQTQLNNCVSASADNTITGHTTFTGNVTFSNNMNHRPAYPWACGYANWTGTQYTIVGDPATVNVYAINRLANGRVQIQIPTTTNINHYAFGQGNPFFLAMLDTRGFSSYSGYKIEVYDWNYTSGGAPAYVTFQIYDNTNAPHDCPFSFLFF